MADNLQKELHRFVEEVVLPGNTARIPEFVSKDYVEHEEAPGAPTGIQSVYWWTEQMNAGFSNLHWSIEQTAQDGNTLWSRSRIKGTHTGTAFGIPATNKPFEVDTMDCLHFNDEGLVVEHWGVTDFAGMLTQLGLMEQPDYTQQ